MIAQVPPEEGPLPLQDVGAVELLRRGVAVTPELLRGVRLTVAMALVGAAGRLAVPILIQQVVDRGLVDGSEYDAGFVWRACATAAVLILGVAILQRATFIRLAIATENALYAIRTRAFAKIHKLSIADHNDTQRGVLVARVTSDIETLARFAQWAGMSWIINSTLLMGILVVMLVYSWQLTLAVLVVFIPLLPALRAMQKRQLAAYDDFRTAVGETLSEMSESVGGAAVIRAYGLGDRARSRLERVIDNQYRARMRAVKFFAIMFPMGDVFASFALSAVVIVGVEWGAGWDLEVGTMLAFLFLVNLLAHLRSSGALALPWFLLGHAQIRLLPMIQIADLFGVYGVSFVVAAVNGALADLLLSRWGWPKAPRAEFTAPRPRASLIAAGVALMRL